MHIAVIIYALVIALAIYGALRGTDLDDPLQRFYLWAIVVAGVLYGLMVASSATEVTVAIDDGTLEVEVMATMLRYRRGVVKRVPRERLSKVYERSMRGLVHNVQLRDATGRNLAAFPRFLEREDHARMVAAIIEWGNQPSSGNATVAEGASR